MSSGAWLSRLSSTVRRIDAEPTFIIEISVTPTSSAVAVAAVRPGFRTALATASRPVAPASREASTPTTRSTAGTNSGLASSTPRNDTKPPATPSTRPGPRLPETRVPATTANVPATRSTMPVPSRTTPCLVRTPTARSGRSAERGGTRVAWRAGTNAAPTVVTIPAASGSTSATASSRRAPGGSPSDIPPSTLTATPARPTPTARPSNEPTTPSATDSTRTAPNTCRRWPPTQRSRASSRVRCASTMVKVFDTTRVATKTAMPANPTRRPPSTSTSPVRDDTMSEARSSAVCTSTWRAPRSRAAAASADRTRVRSSAGVVLTSTSSNDVTTGSPPAGWSDPEPAFQAATDSSEATSATCTSDEPATMPTTRTRSRGAPPYCDTRRCAPSRRCRSLAVSSATATSPCRSGSRPARSWYHRRSVSAGTLDTRAQLRPGDPG